MKQSKKSSTESSNDWTTFTSSDGKSFTSQNPDQKIEIILSRSEKPVCVDIELFIDKSLTNSKSILHPTTFTDFRLGLAQLGEKWDFVKEKTDRIKIINIPVCHREKITSYMSRILNIAISSLVVSGECPIVPEHVGHDIDKFIRQIQNGITLYTNNLANHIIEPKKAEPKSPPPSKKPSKITNITQEAESIETGWETTK